MSVEPLYRPPLRFEPYQKVYMDDYTLWASYEAKTAENHYTRIIYVEPLEHKTIIVYAVKVGSPGDLTLAFQGSFSPHPGLFADFESPVTLTASGDIVLASSKHMRFARLRAKPASADDLNYWQITAVMAGKG